MFSSVFQGCPVFPPQYGYTDFPGKFPPGNPTFQPAHGVLRCCRGPSVSGPLHPAVPDSIGDTFRASCGDALPALIGYSPEEGGTETASAPVAKATVCRVKFWSTLSGPPDTPPAVPSGCGGARSGGALRQPPELRRKPPGSSREHNAGGRALRTLLGEFVGKRGRERRSGGFQV